MSQRTEPSSAVLFHEGLHLWWPVADGDPVVGHGSVVGKLSDVDLSVAQCKHHRTVVQAGAHVGLWPLRLSKSFKQVIAFEVQPGCYEAARRNCAEANNVSISPLGLGA
jgi:hypothetical protein